MAKRSFTPRSSDSLLFGAVSRGDDGKFLSVDIGVASLCDDECDQDSESFLDISLLNARHPNGAFYMERLESVDDRTARLLMHTDTDLRGMEIHMLNSDELLCCANGDPLEFAILCQEAQAARNELEAIERQRQADEANLRRNAFFKAQRLARRARRQAAIAQA